MIKIEMSVQVSEEFPAGRSSEYIWMSGQHWPVPADEDSRIMRIEMFGNELDEVGAKFSGGFSLKDETTGKVTCRTWHLSQARYLSEQMRVFYP